MTGYFNGVVTFYSANQKDTKITVDPVLPSGTFLAKYSSSGTLLWVQTGQGYSLNGPGYGVAVNTTAGSVYIAATECCHIEFLSSADGTTATLGQTYEAMFLAKYDTNGNLQWVTQAGACCAYLIPYGVTVDSEGNAYAFGWFQIEGYFGSTSGSAIYVPAFIGPDIYLAKYDKNGKIQWVNHIGGGLPSAVTIGPSGEVTLVGLLNSGAIRSPPPSLQARTSIWVVALTPPTLMESLLLTIRLE